MNERGEAELDDLIAQATIDCYSEDEELTGFATMIGDNLAVPFETTVLGVTVTVRKIDYTDSGIVAICARGRHRQAIPVWSSPVPNGRRSASSGAFSPGWRTRSAMPADTPGVYSALRTAVSRLRERRAGSGHTSPGQAPEAARVQAALEMHELGVRMYR